MQVVVPAGGSCRTTAPAVDSSKGQDGTLFQLLLVNNSRCSANSVQLLFLHNNHNVLAMTNVNERKNNVRSNFQVS